MILDRDALLAGLRRLARTRRIVSGIPVGAVEGDFARIADALGEDIASERFAFEPLEPFVHHVDGRARTLYRATPLDQAVLFALARLLTKAVEPRLSPSCFSYRRGMSARSAQKALVEYISEHKRGRPVEKRGLYVIRTDIASYGESIRVDDESPLWSELRQVIRDEQTLALLAAAIRQPVTRRAGPARPLERGIPTGSPIQPPLCNLYLARTDDRMLSVPGLGYARYGDDLLLAHASPEALGNAFSELQRDLEQLGLVLRPEKTRRTCFNGAGRILDAGVSGYRPRQHVEYLGARISFAGHITATKDKRASFLAGLRARLGATCDALGEDSLDARGLVACEILRRALDFADPLAEPRAVAFFGRDVDRAARLSLISDLELLVAEVVTNRRGRRAFRRASPKKLRAWGFPRLDVPQRKVGSPKG